MGALHLQARFELEGARLGADLSWLEAEERAQELGADWLELSLVEERDWLQREVRSRLGVGRLAVQSVQMRPKLQIPTETR
jgi:hypothetical protein